MTELWEQFKIFKIKSYHVACRMSRRYTCTDLHGTINSLYRDMVWNLGAGRCPSRDDAVYLAQDKAIAYESAISRLTIYGD